MAVDASTWYGYKEPLTKEEQLEEQLFMMRHSITELNDRIASLEKLIVRIDEEDKAYLLLRYTGDVHDDEGCKL